ncbi:hypothetical protein LTR28_002195 [Elasticomyces elasticus]|nr:hypothetical protein LTR28_002195 [Elasticomyces elasticus]
MSSPGTNLFLAANPVIHRTRASQESQSARQQTATSPLRRTIDFAQGLVVGPGNVSSGMSLRPCCRCNDVDTQEHSTAHTISFSSSPFSPSPSPAPSPQPSTNTSANTELPSSALSLHHPRTTTAPQARHPPNPRGIFGTCGYRQSAHPAWRSGTVVAQGPPGGYAPQLLGTG